MKSASSRNTKPDPNGNARRSTLFKKSGTLVQHFPTLCREWDYLKNEADNLRPSQVSPKSNFKAWWICKRSSHSWRATIAHRTKGIGCPYCSRKKVAPEDSLAQLHPVLLMEWHNERNHAIDPLKVAPGSDKIVWWRCHKRPVINPTASTGYFC